MTHSHDLRRYIDAVALVEAQQTETPEFKRWFGASKVVGGGDGKPLVVYKGMYPYDWSKDTANRGPELDRIDRPGEFPALNSGESGVKIAGFFTDNRDVASSFALKQGAVYPVYLSFQRPFMIDAKGDFAGNTQFGGTGRAFREAIRSGRFDSVIIKNTRDEGTIYVALRPEQVKSAIGNRGTFDAASPRIAEQENHTHDLRRYIDAVQTLVEAKA